MSSGKAKAILPYAGLLAAAAYLYHDAGSFAAAAKVGQLGPDFWPRAVLVLLMIVCAIEIGRHALSAAVAPAAEAAAADEGPRFPRLLAAGMLITALYVPGMDYLGFFLATVAYLAAFMVVGRYRRWGVIATTSIVGSLAFVYVFMKVVYVSLPLGVGPFREVSTALMSILGIH
ncbi:MAG TPA: tripartite tricarboxylate transporter TctB family protein [Usitatibacter sp.]|jgi:putative tricarboxylic transport membrane protein|nr:tripartite tricarboxylate transporter TctB family protein [Usitatibacter sp.]